MRWVPLERDRLMRDWDAAGEAWDRVQGLRDDDPNHPDVLWAAMLLNEAREGLAAHDRFAEWATRFLTARWRKRMQQLVELW